MSSIITSIFKATIGLLVKKARSKTAEKLKDGDVADQKFRSLIVSEIDDIKSKLDGLARKDLLASIEFFKGGVLCLNQVFKKTVNDRTDDDRTDDDIPAAVKTPLLTGIENGKSTDNSLTAQAVSEVTTGAQDLWMTDLNESAKLSLADAKRRFKDSRRKATEAFSNVALSTADRILAIEFQVMASILERVDRPIDALDECRLCLSNLHSLQAVRENFKVQMAGGVKSLLNKKEREEIIANVFLVNLIIFKVTRLVEPASKFPDETWPFIDIGGEQVQLLTDRRLIKKLGKLGLDDCLIKWSFGQEGDTTHKLKCPTDMTVNSQDHFLVADKGDNNIKVFNGNGSFLYSLSASDEEGSKLIAFIPWCVATDPHDNVYILASVEKIETSGWRGIYVFDKHGQQTRMFHLTEGSYCWQMFSSKEGSYESFGWQLTVNRSKQVFVLCKRDGSRRVDIYDSEGHVHFRNHFKVLSDSCRITATNDGRVMVLDHDFASVLVFTVDGNHLQSFKVQGDISELNGEIAFGHISGNVVIASGNSDTEQGQVSIYSKDGEFLYSIQLATQKQPWLRGAAVTVDGHIAVLSVRECKVYVV